jgi:4-amino-4-deoxy-L-arabinose transferase-like glycosyltransferase
VKVIRVAGLVPGLIAFVAPLALFLAAAYPTVEFADPGELQTVAPMLGIAHPTGFPTFILLGWLFSHLIPFGNEAWRVTAMCAVAMAVASWLLYLSAREIDVDAVSACGAAVAFSAGTTAWIAGSHADIQALGTMFAAALIWLALRWRNTRDVRLLYAGGVITGIAAANHPLAIFAIPGLLVLVLSRAQGVRARDTVAAVLLVVVGLSLYAYLPIRSAIVTAERRDPTLALGFPPGMAFWDYNHPSAAAGLIRDVSGADFAPGSTAGAFLTAAPYERLRKSYLPLLGADFGPLLLLAAAIGALVLFRRDAWLAAGLLLSGFLPALFGLGYLAEQDFERYFLGSFWIVALAAGAGVSYVLVAALRSRPRLGAGASAAFFAATIAVLVLDHRAILSHHADDSGHRFLDYIRARTPENAIVVAAWAYATPLAYGAYVEHSLGERIVVSGWPEEWEVAYAAWARARPLYAVSNQPIHLRSSTTRLVDEGSGPILVQVDP